MVRILNYRGRLGNNLFQYSFARILADLTGKQLITKSFDNLPEIKNVEGTINHNLVTIKDCEENEGLIVDLNELKRKDFNFGFGLDGFFQHRSYYESRRNQIKEWLFDVPTTKPETMAVHIRLTDYVDIGWDLPTQYYDDCIKSINPKNVLIFTDDPNHDYIKQLCIQGAILSKEYNDVEDLKSMASCEHIVMSRSSFSWWAAFLSNAKEIYFPRPSSGMWSLKDTPHKDLFLNYPEYKIINL